MRDHRTITGAARLAGVMGWPIGHSLSPVLHGYWLAEHGIDGAYVPLAVEPTDAVDALRALPRLGFRGCNVTVPLKETALNTVDRVTVTARRIGAVNTVTVDDNGQLEGDNTDAFGFLANLQQAIDGWTARTGPALVLGAGGAARAVVTALVDDGAPEVRIANRTADRAKRLAADNGSAVIRTVAWEDRVAASRDAALIVNTTSVGMTGQPPLDMPLDDVPANAVVHDIVYAPLETPLLAAARARGNVAVDGLGMLLHQARPGFERWFGARPEVTPALRDFVLAHLARR